MLFSTVGQGYVFLWMAIAGLLIGALYTLACGVRRLMEAGFWLSLAIDCVFGLGAAMILVAALITGTYGVVRLYGFLGAAMGELLYFVGVAPLLKRIFAAVTRCFRRMFQRISNNRLIKVIFR